jgi:long-chain acyl-CoA synthetase
VHDIRNVADLVRRAATEGPDRPALRSHDRSLTWGELDAQVDAVAAALSDLADAGKDEPSLPNRVAIALPNVPEFAAAFFGTVRAGLVAVPVNPAYTARELTEVLADCGPVALIATAQVLAGLGDGVPATLRRTYSLGAAPGAASFADLLRGGGGAGHDAGAPAATPPPQAELAVLLYTSGTEGVPKGAMLSHRALLANHAQLAALDPAPFGPDDIALLVLPMFHAYGLNSGLVAVAYHGACGVFVERFDPADALGQIVRHGVTVVIGVPSMYVAWSLMDQHLGQAFQGVRLAGCGAAPLDPETGRRFSAATGRTVFEGYGLTETAPVLTSTLASPHHKPGSIGRPLPGVELKLVTAGGDLVYPVDDEDSDVDDDFDLDSPASPGTDPGEIVVRGPNLFDGYWPDGRGGPDVEGWWATGDVAYADADSDLFLVDRLGELILVSGFNVYPREVEQVLAAHPAVAEAAAVGVPHPYTGQTVKVFVVRRPDMELTTEELLAHCERNLARFKCPTSVEFVAQLPHTAIGKVRKVALRGLFG